MPFDPPPLRSPRARWRARWLAVFGPGLVVMLADTDVGSIITAGQSGMAWGYRLLLLQFLLIPVLYVVQELTVRLGIFTGRGHGELIRETFGPGWAWVSAAGLAVASVGALLTEFSGIAGVGEMFGVSRFLTLPLAAVGLLAVVATGSYRRVERVAIVIGLFELAFFGVAWAARPHVGELLHQALDMPLRDRGYLWLVAANIGAVIMPWMVFYQQSAIADKGLGLSDLPAARLDTAVGAVVTQMVMAAVLIATAAVLGGGRGGIALDTVGQISQALAPSLGATAGRVVFGLGVLGAAMVAAIVASLALAWGLGEVAGYRRSLECHPREARWFYGVYAACVLGGAALVAVSPDLVALSLGVEVMNALLLPVVLGFLIALARRALPREHRPAGLSYAVILGVGVVVCGFGVIGGLGALLP